MFLYKIYLGLKAIENKRKEIDDKNDEINSLREQVNKAQVKIFIICFDLLRTYLQM